MGIISNITSALLARGVSSFKDSLRRNVMPSSFGSDSGDRSLLGGISNIFYGPSKAGPTLNSFDEVVPIKEPILNRADYKPERVRPDDIVRSLDRIHGGLGNYLTQINRNTMEIFRYVKDYSKQQDMRFTNIQKDSVQIRKTQDQIVDHLQKMDYRLRNVEQAPKTKGMASDTRVVPQGKEESSGLLGVLGSLGTAGQVAVGVAAAGGAAAVISTARAAIQGLVRAGAAMLRGGAKGGLIGGSIAILQLLNSDKVKKELGELLKKKDNFSDDEVIEFFKLSIEDQGKVLDALGYKPAEIEKTATEVRQDHLKKRNERKDQKWNENVKKFWDSNSNNREERQNYKKERDDRKDKSWRDKWDKFWNKSSNDDEPQPQGSKAGPMMAIPALFGMKAYGWLRGENKDNSDSDPAQSDENLKTVEIVRGQISFESRIGDFNLTSRRDLVQKSESRIILTAKEIVFDAPSIVFKSTPKSGDTGSHSEFEEKKRAQITSPESAPTVATPDNLRPFTIDEVRGSVFGEQGDKSSMGARPKREGAPVGGGTKRSAGQPREAQPETFGPPTTSFSQNAPSQGPSFSPGPTTSQEAPWVKSMRQQGGTDGGIDRSQFQNEWQNESLLREMAVLTKNEVGLSNTNRSQAFMETLHNRAWNEKGSLQSRIRNGYYPDTWKGKVTDEEFQHFKENILGPVQAGSNVSAVNGVPSTHNASAGVAERSRQKGGGWKYMGEETIGYKPHEKANLDKMPRLKSLTGGVTEGSPNFALGNVRDVEKSVRGYNQVTTTPVDRDIDPSLLDPNKTRLPNMSTPKGGPIGRSQGSDGRYPADSERLFHKGGQLSGVDPKLMHILKEASKDLPDGYRAEVISGKDGRSTGTTNHPGGIAVDLQIYDKEGKMIPYDRNSAGWKEYEKMYQSVVERGKVLYPKEDWIWGGAWISSAAGRGDPMHFQRLDKSVGGSSTSSGRYDPDKGLSPDHPFANEFGGKSHMNREELAAYKGGIREKAKSEYTQPSAKITTPNLVQRQFDEQPSVAQEKQFIPEAREETPSQTLKDIKPAETPAVDSPTPSDRLMGDIFGKDKWQQGESAGDRAKRLMQQWRERNPQLMPRSDQPTIQDQRIDQLKSETQQKEMLEPPAPAVTNNEQEMKQLEKRIKTDESVSEKKMIETKHNPEQEESRPGSPEGRGGAVSDPDAVDLN